MHFRFVNHQSRINLRQDKSRECSKSVKKNYFCNFVYLQLTSPFEGEVKQTGHNQVTIKLKTARNMVVILENVIFHEHLEGQLVRFVFIFYNEDYDCSDVQHC